MTRIMHVITTLGPAGAETMLCQMVRAMDRSRFENEIVSLTGILDLAEKMEGAGVKVRTLGMKKSVPNPLLVMRLAKWIRESRPDVIHTWMYHANLVGALAARLVGNVPVVWGIHCGLGSSMGDRRTSLVNRACALLSGKWPARIICCAQESMCAHKELGYAAEKLEVIPNGFDLKQFKPDLTARASLRDELGVPVRTPLIGMAARFHPEKDHWNFIQAAAQLHKQIPDSHFLLCGLDITWQNQELRGWIEAAGICDCCHLLGVRQDMSRLYSGMDIATISSRTEAFPVVIGEAMACGTPCIVTDVGDSALIVGKTGTVVAPGNPDALAAAWRKLMEAGLGVRHGLGVAARNRVQQHFALSAVVGRYQTIYTQLAGGTLDSASSTALCQCARETPPV